MEEYKIDNATVRIRGEVNKEKIEEATKIFMKKVCEQKQRDAKKNEK